MKIRNANLFRKSNGPRRAKRDKYFRRKNRRTIKPKEYNSSILGGIRDSVKSANELAQTIRELVTKQRLSTNALHHLITAYHALKRQVREKLNQARSGERKRRLTPRHKMRESSMRRVVQSTVTH
jgi:hypothetical protein